MGEDDGDDTEAERRRPEHDAARTDDLDLDRAVRTPHLVHVAAMVQDRVTEIEQELSPDRDPLPGIAARRR